MQIAVVSAQRSVALTRLTVRYARAAVPEAVVHVLDVDGTYRPAGGERVRPADSLRLTRTELHRRAVVLEPADLVRSLQPVLLRALHDEHPDDVKVLLAPGVLLLREPQGLLTAPDDPMVLVSRTAGPPPRDGRHPDVEDVSASGAYAPLVLLRHPAPGLLHLWERTTAGPELPSPRWLDVAAATFAHSTVREPEFLVSAGSLRGEHTVTGRGHAEDPLLLDGRPVTAVDLSNLDPTAPWLLDVSLGDPRARLSDHPALAELVLGLASRLRVDDDRLEDGAPAGGWDLTTTALGIGIDPVLRSLYRSLLDRESAPDPFDPAAGEALLDFLTEPEADGGPGRYLRTLHASRPDLQLTFPHVPGEDDPAFLAWARDHAVAEGYPAAVVTEAVRRSTSVERPSGRPAPGVNVVGFLRGELGIGESARQMVSALDAAGVAHRAVAVSTHLTSRQQAGPGGGPPRPSDAIFDTSIVCVNADLTPTVARSVPALMERSYRIGMWYWEVEDFPASQHGGFEHLDEVWVATDFVRRAVEPHSPVPVRVITPPLPQRGREPEVSRSDLGLPDGPVLLFSFDFLSTAERKNPFGLIAAFRAAFRPGAGPVLVIKSINAEHRPAQAERLRLAAAQHPDVLLLEGYLSPGERDALVAHCDGYVSLHRSEGLGLTMAEAMAWGKPVIATGYSGNLQFMTEENSFLVPWAPVAIPPGAEPYPAGGTWAEPDLAAAAEAMRTVVGQPEVAAERGARAAADIAERHSPEVAGRAVAARLDEIADRRRSRSRTTVVSRLRSTARSARGALR